MAHLGHCRHATIGGITRETAHPFTHGKVTGMHNGTLDYGWENSLDYGETFEVDSEALIFNIASVGVETAIPMVSGAWCLVWWDEEEQTFNFLRNEERPLWFAFSKNGKKMYYASETWMISAMLREGRYKRGELQTDDEGHCFWALPKNTLRRIKVNPNAVDPFTQLEDTKVEGGEPYSYYTSPSAWGSSATSFINGVRQENTPKQIKDHSQSLDDALPPSLTHKGSQEESKTTGTTSPNSTETSKSKGLQTKQSSQSSNSKLSLSSPKGEHSKRSKDLSEKPTINKYGEDFDNPLVYLSLGSGREYNWDYLDHECSFCQSSCDPEDVATVLEESRGIICEECFNPPSIRDVVKNIC